MSVSLSLAMPPSLVCVRVRLSAANRNWPNQSCCCFRSVRANCVRSRTASGGWRVSLTLDQAHGPSKILFPPPPLPPPQLKLRPPARQGQESISAERAVRTQKSATPIARVLRDHKDSRERPKWRWPLCNIARLLYRKHSLAARARTMRMPALAVGARAH